MAWHGTLHFSTGSTNKASLSAFLAALQHLLQHTNTPRRSDGDVPIKGAIQRSCMRRRRKKNRYLQNWNHTFQNPNAICHGLAKIQNNLVLLAPNVVQTGQQSLHSALHTSQLNNTLKQRKERVVCSNRSLAGVNYKTKSRTTCKKNNRTKSRWKNYTTKTETIPKHDVQNTRKFLGPCFTCAHFALGLACGAPRQNCLVTKGVFSRIRHVQETVFILVFVVNLRHE